MEILYPNVRKVRVYRSGRLAEIDDYLLRSFFEENDRLKAVQEQENKTDFAEYKHGGKGAFCINDWGSYVNYSVLIESVSLNSDHKEILGIIKCDGNYNDAEEIVGNLSFGSIEFFCSNVEKKNLTYQEAYVIIGMLEEIRHYSDENCRSISITFADAPFQKIGLVNHYSSRDIDLIIEALKGPFMNQPEQYIKR